MLIILSMVFIENNNLDPALNHAIELYVMDTFNEDVFMLWRNSPCILLGRYQNINSEVNLEFTKKHGIEVVRRLSGGGAIYCDPDNMQYTFITQKRGHNNLFKKFAKPVVKGLKSLGLNAEFTGRNDIQIDGVKVSGNAQFHKNGKVMHHGTLLFKANTENLSNALKFRKIKFKDKAVRSVVSRVGFIGDFINMNIQEFKLYMEEFIKTEFDIKKSIVLTFEEMQKIKKIRSQIFAKKEWNYGNPFLKKNKSANKYSCGVLELGIDTEDGKIKDVVIEGDFFSELGIENLCSILKGVECSRKAVEKALENLYFHKYIQSMEKEVFISELVKLF